MTDNNQTTGMNQPGMNQPEKASAYEITRRRFLTLVFGLASALGLGAFAAPLVRYAYPVLKGEVYEKVKVSTTADVTADGVRFDYQDVPSMVIQKKDKSYAAFSLVCTHLGCIVKWVAKDNDFECPCHGGKFDENGKNVAGPPPSPLTQYNLTVQGTDIYVEGIKT